MKETPAIFASNYTNSTVDLSTTSPYYTYGAAQVFNVWDQIKGDYEESARDRQAVESISRTHKPIIERTVEIMANSTRRVVQVFIADTNENVPLEQSVLFTGDQKLTDLTDTELFFEVPIADLLTKHNAKRVTWLDKEATKRSGKDVTLDPARIRELNMVVVTVAQF